MPDRPKMTSATTPSDLAADLASRPEPSEEEKRAGAESIAKDLDLDPDFVEAAGNAKAAEVEATSKRVAEDVSKSVETDERPKKKGKGVPRAGAPKPHQSVSRPEHDPLQGAKIDPDDNYPKIVQLIVTTERGDERSMEEFIENAKQALMSQADAKMVTVLLSKVQVDGKHILNHHYEAEVERLGKKG